MRACLTPYVDRPLCSKSRLVGSYSMHAMGANCLSVRLQSLQYQSGPSSSLLTELCVCSGGDDQAIGVLSLSLHLTAPCSVESHAAAEVQISIEACRVVRIHGACGSAIKGVSSMALPGQDATRAFGLVSVGYDQRLSLWEYSETSPSADHSSTSKCTEEHYDLSVSGPAGGHATCPLQWKGGSVVNVGDVNSMALQQSTGGVHIAVVGEGFQEFHIIPE